MFTLKNVLLANALSCLGFGTVFVLIAPAVATFLSADIPAPGYLVQLMGGVLIFHGGHLWWASRTANLPHWMVVYFSFGDFLWVALSAVLILTGYWVTTPYGTAATILVALVVGAMGVLQLIRAHQHVVADT